MPFESAKTPLNFSMLAYNLYVEVSSNKGYLYGVVPITRIIIFWSLDWGPLFWETTISPCVRHLRFRDHKA